MKKNFGESLSATQSQFIDYIREHVVLCQDLVQVKMRNFSPF